MKFDSNCGYFVDITKEERPVIFQLCYDIVINGKIPTTTNPIVEKFVEAFDVRKESYLLAMSTVFPQRMLLSLCLSQETDDD